MWTLLPGRGLSGLKCPLGGAWLCSPPDLGLPEPLGGEPGLGAQRKCRCSVLSADRERLAGPGSTKNGRARSQVTFLRRPAAQTEQHTDRKGVLLIATEWAFKPGPAALEEHWFANESLLKRFNNRTGL